MTINNKKEVVKRVINEWDPINLFPEAPENEYWSEIDSIIEKSSRLENSEELAKVIQTVFIDSFDEDIFRYSFEECLKIAGKILIEVKKEE